MSLSAVRAAIVAKLNAVPGIGRVHNYERFAATNSKFIELYANDDDQILGWHVRRVATASQFITFNRWKETTSWEIRGYAGLNDAAASELALDELVELIRAAFRADDTLGGVVDTCTTNEAAGVQLADSGPVMFAGVLSNSVRLSLRTVSTVIAP